MCPLSPSQRHITKLSGEHSTTSHVNARFLQFLGSLPSIQPHMSTVCTHVLLRCHQLVIPSRTERQWCYSSISPTVNECAHILYRAWCSALQHYSHHQCSQMCTGRLGSSPWAKDINQCKKPATMQMCTHTHAHTHTRTHALACTRTHLHAHACTCMHTHARTHTHTHTHTHIAQTPATQAFVHES